MQKNENPIILAAILFAITAVVALLLALANTVTADKIAENAAKEQNEARIEVMPDATSFEKVEQTFEDSAVNEIYAAMNNADELLGYCVSVSPNGFGGAIEMIVGVKTDASLTGLKIVSLSETPGLGSKAQEPKFKDQFNGKSVAEPIALIKSGTPKDNEVVAISGATITSHAVTSGVNAAAEAVKNLK